MKLKTVLFVASFVLSYIPIHVSGHSESPEILADDPPRINQVDEVTTNQDEQTTGGNPTQPQFSLFMPDDLEAILDTNDNIENCNDTAQGGTGTILSVNITWIWYNVATITNDIWDLNYGIGTDCNTGAPASWTTKETVSTAPNCSDATKCNSTFNATADRSWTWADITNTWIQIDGTQVTSPDSGDLFWDAGFITVVRSVSVNTAPTIDDKIVEENWDEDSLTSHRWNATDPDPDTWTWTVESDPAQTFLDIEQDDLSAWVNGSCRPEGSYEVWTNISDGTDSDSDQWTLTCNNQLPTIDDPIVEEHWDQDANVVHQWNSTDSDLDPHTWTVEGNATFVSIDSQNRTAWVNGSCEQEGFFNLWTNVTDGTSIDSDAWVLFCDNVAPVISDPIVQETWDEDANVVHQWNSTDSDQDTHTWTVEGEVGFLTIDSQNRTAWANGSCEDEGSFSLWTNVTDGTASDSNAWTLICANVAPTIIDKIVEEHWDEDANIVHQWNSSDSDEDTHTWTVEGNASFVSIDSQNRTAWVNGSCEDEGFFNLWTNVTDSTSSDSDAWVLFCNNVAPTIDDKIVEEHWLAGTAVVHQWNSSDADEDSHTWTAEGNHTFGALEFSNRTAWFNGTCAVGDIGFFNVWTNVTDGTASDSDAWVLFCDNNLPTIDDKIIEENWLVNVATSHQWNSSDADTQAHTWTLTGNASFLTLEQDNRTAWANGTCLVGGEFYNVWVNVTDGIDTDSDDWVLFCQLDNSAPVITNPLVEDRATVEDNYFFEFSATDVDNDALTWTLETDATFLDIVSSDATGTVFGTPSKDDEGIYFVNVIVSDGSLTDNNNYTLRVTIERNPTSVIRVFTHSTYDILLNSLTVEMWWFQEGGPEVARISKRELIVTIDGTTKTFEANNITDIPVPWNYLDGGVHNITITGALLINWTKGPTISLSDPEIIVADNSTRALILYLIITSIAVISLMAVVQVFKGNKNVKGPKSKRRN